MERKVRYGADYNQTRHVEITQHAMQRLQERVVFCNGYRSWQHMVRTARYEGRNESMMTDSEYEWFTNNIQHLSNSSQVRLLDGFAFIFKGDKGHARTLVTLIQAAQEKMR